jgi:hypothetical protein
MKTMRRAAAASPRVLGEPAPPNPQSAIRNPPPAIRNVGFRLAFPLQAGWTRNPRCGFFDQHCAKRSIPRAFQLREQTIRVAAGKHPLVAIRECHDNAAGGFRLCASTGFAARLLSRVGFRASCRAVLKFANQRRVNEMLRLDLDELHSGTLSEHLAADKQKG